MRAIPTALCSTAILLGACSKSTPPPASPAPSATQPSTALPQQPNAAAPAPAQPAPAAAPLTEKAKIEKLLESLAASSDTFTRNGSDYTGKQAADHLASKWKSAGDRVKTARNFIDGLASKSSFSGKPYTVKRTDGTTVNAADWFNQQLKLIEESAASK